MDKVTLEYSYKPVHVDLESGETRPVFFWWSSATPHWSTWAPLEDEPPKEGTWTGWKRVEIPIRDTRSLRLDEQIHAQVLVHSPNIEGGLTMAKAGSGSFLLVHLKRRREELESSEIDLILPTFYDESTEQPYQKGLLRVRLVASEGRMDKWRFRNEVGRYDLLSVNSGHMDMILSRAVGRNMYPFSKQARNAGHGLIPATKAVKRVHAPVWTNEAATVPGPWFWHNHTHSQPDERYYANLARVALGRYAMSEEDFISICDRQFGDKQSDTISPDFRQAVRVWADMLTIVSTAMPYIGDYTYVERKGFWSRSFERVSIESFHDALRLRGGDCEDLGRLIHYHHQAIKYGANRDSTPAIWTDPIVQRMQRICQLYVGLGNLGTVTDPSLVQHKGAKQMPKIGSPEDLAMDNKVGAHMWWEGVPLVKVERLINRTSKAGESPFRMDPGRHDMLWEQDLPHVVGEGTGYLDPFLEPPRNEAEIRHKMQYFRALRKVMKPSKHLDSGQMQSTQRIAQDEPDLRYSTFYRRSVSCSTDEFARHGHRILELTWAHRNSEGRWVYAVNMRDKLRDDGARGLLGLVPTPGYDDEERSVVESILRQAPPHAVPTLMEHSGAASAAEDTAKFVNRLQRNLNKAIQGHDARVDNSQVSARVLFLSLTRALR